MRRVGHGVMLHRIWLQPKSQTGDQDQARSDRPSSQVSNGDFDGSFLRGFVVGIK